MKVKDVMTSHPISCMPDTTLAEAAHLMWEADCGILPIVDKDGKLAGVVTDRDLYIALATRNETAAHLTVGAVARRNLVTCAPDEDVRDALEKMRHNRVRRLPVVGFADVVLGLLSMNDIVLEAGPGKPVNSDDVVATLQAICGHHHPVAPVVTA